MWAVKSLRLRITLNCDLNIGVVFEHDRGDLLVHLDLVVMAGAMQLATAEERLGGLLLRPRRTLRGQCPVRPSYMRALTC